MPHILNVTVPIPETHVLITKDEYEELIAYSLDPVWNMSDFKEEIKNCIWWNNQRQVIISP